MKGLLRKFKFKKLNKPLKIIVIILICFAFVVPTITFSKYIYDLITYSIYNSQNFYFKSNYLTEDNPEYTINSWDGKKDYVLDINMNSILNELKKATAPINYDIEYECIGDVRCTISKTEGVIPVNDPDEDKNNKDKFTITLKPNHVFSASEEAEIKIKTTSTSPYVKSLSASFKLKVSVVGLSYEVTDNVNDIFAVLRLTNSSATYIVGDEDITDYASGAILSIDQYNALSDADKEKVKSAEAKISFDPTEVQLDVTNPYYLKATDIVTDNYYVCKSEVRDYKVGNIISADTYNESGNEGIRSSFEGPYQYVKEFKIKINALTSADIIFYKSDKRQNYTYRVESDYLVTKINK